MITVRGDPDQPNHVIVALQGELDLSAGFEVRELLIAELARGNDVLVNLSQLEFVDSTGLAALLIAGRTAESIGRRLRLTGQLKPQVHRVLRLTGADRMLLLE